MNGSIRYQEISSEATSRITPGVDHESKSFDGIEAQNPSNSRSNSSRRTVFPLFNIGLTKYFGMLKVL